MQLQDEASRRALEPPHAEACTRGAHHGNDQAARAPDLVLAVAVLDVLPQQARVLLVQAHGLLDHERLACTQSKDDRM
jgi:hypothetical protein